MLRKLVAQLPELRGKQRLLSVLDQLLGPVVMKARGGVFLEGYYSSAQDKSFLNSQVENERLEEEISTLGESAVVIDCGANCGYYSAKAAQKLGKDGVVISVEPSQREYRRLLKAISLNSHQGRWIPINVAAGADNAVVYMNTNVGHTGMNQVCTRQERTEQVTLQLSIDQIIDWTIGSRRTIDLIKIDVEGYELNVLKGAQQALARGQVRLLVVEITESFLQRCGDSKAKLYKFLASLGYESERNLDIWQYDEVFCRSANQVSNIVCN